MPTIDRPAPVVLTPDGDFTPDALKLLRFLAARFARYYKLDRDDVFREASIHAFRHGRGYDPERGKLPGWLAYSVRRAARSLAGRQSRHAHDELPDDGVGVEPDPGRAMERAEEATVVRDALRQLHPARRAEVVARFGLDGEPPAAFKDVAGDGCTPVAALYRVRQSLRRLETVLAGRV